MVLFATFSCVSHLNGPLCIYWKGVSENMLEFPHVPLFAHWLTDKVRKNRILKGPWAKSYYSLTVLLQMFFSSVMEVFPVWKVLLQWPLCDDITFSALPLLLCVNNMGMSSPHQIKTWFQMKWSDLSPKGQK